MLSFRLVEASVLVITGIKLIKMKVDKTKDKVKTKFDCPYYLNKGGHCQLRVIKNRHLTLRFGCGWAEDISKCPHKKNAEKESFLWKHS